MNTQTDILDNRILQDMQDSYVSTLPVYAYCYGRPFERLTRFSGGKEAEAFFNRHISEDAKKILVASFSDGDAENVIMAEADVPYISVCGVAIRDTDGKALGAWIFMGVSLELVPEDEEPLPEGISCTTIVEFDHIITLITKISGMYFAAHGRSVSADAKLSVASSTEEELLEEKRRSDALENILKLLDSENDFAIVASDILRIAGDYLGLSDALLLRLDAGVTEVDVVSDYTADEDDAVIGYFLNMKRSGIPFLTNREYTVSTDSIMPDSFRDFFRKYGITAGVFLPLLIEEHVSMYLCFIMRNEARKWKVKELSFLNQVKYVVRTILSARMTQNSVAGAYAALDEVLENAAYALAVAAPGEDDYIYANERFGHILEDPRDCQNFHDLVAESFGEEDVSDRTFYADVAKCWYKVHIAPIRWMDGRNVRIITLYDITEVKRYEQKMEEQARTDYLTGLYNRQQFERDLSVAAKDALRSGDQGSFLYINLDGFKDVNGEYGHSFGDALLKEAAKAIENICRTRASCYRLNGDEFGVLVPFYEYAELNRLVGTIQRRFEQSWNLGGKEYTCTMSMGVVCFPKDGADIRTIMRNADIALGMAKGRAPGTVAWYSNCADEENEKRYILEEALRTAVENGCREFCVTYEPLMEKDPKASGEGGIASSGTIKSCAGAKVDCYWESPSLGRHNPQTYAPMAEYLGLLGRIDGYMLREAGRHCRYWNDFGHPEYRIYVELSTQFMLLPDSSRVIKNILEETGVNPGNVVFHTGKASNMRDAQRMEKNMEDVASCGATFLSEKEKKEVDERILPGGALLAEDFEEKYMD